MENISMLIPYVILTCIFAILLFFVARAYLLSSFEERIKNFSIDAVNNESESFIDRITELGTKFMKLISKVLKKSDFNRRYSKKFEKYALYNNQDLEPMDYISVKFIAMIAFQVLYLISLVIRLVKINVFTFLIVSILGFFVSDIIYFITYTSRKKKLEEQLLQAVVIMNSAFKSGKNIDNALEIVRSEMPNPIKSEFDIVAKDLSYGLSLYNAFERFASRINLEQARYITASLSLLSKTGGNIVTVFNMIEANFYNRMKIKNELSALTSSSKFLYRVLCLLPFFIVAVIICLSPTYFLPLITTKIGLIVTGLMVLIYVAYLIVIKKVMKVDEL